MSGESAQLLDLMRRVRRRRRWVAGAEGAARGIAAVTLLFAATTVAMRLAGRAGLGARAAASRDVVLAIAAVAASGALAAAVAGVLGRMSLGSCARAVDRASGARDDTVLSAVALGAAAAAAAAAANRFTAALVAEALARARTAVPARVVPPPRRRPFGLAAAGICLWAAATAVPARRLSAAPRRGSGARATPPDTGDARRLRMTALGVDAEREDARAARAAAAGSGDRELDRIAGAFDALLSELTAGHLDAAAALVRLGALARAAADDARRAAAANDAAWRLAAAARGDHTTRAKAAADAAAMLASAEAARADLDGAGPTGARALPAPAKPPTPTEPKPPGASDAGDEQRRLESLRRDLEDAAQPANCQGDPGRCQQQADDVAHARAQLQALGRTAGARDRLAQSARQLQDRLERGGASAPGAPSSSSPTADGRAEDERFARAAAGRRDDSDRGNVTARSASPGDGATPVPARQSAAGADAERATATTGPGQTPGQGTGAGIGTTPGGRVLGPRGAATAPEGHDALETLADADPDAPSRATIIGTAAARGFAGAAYRPVFSEYRAAVEESLDSAAVPPGRRALVRRYFQLIRPRTP